MIRIEQSPDQSDLYRIWDSEREAGFLFRATPEQVEKIMADLDMREYAA